MGEVQGQEQRASSVCTPECRTCLVPFLHLKQQGDQYQ
jgi:hypothetical protein